MHTHFIESGLGHVIKPSTTTIKGRIKSLDGKIILFHHVPDLKVQTPIMYQAQSHKPISNIEQLVVKCCALSAIVLARLDDKLGYDHAHDPTIVKSTLYTPKQQTVKPSETKSETVLGLNRAY